MAAWIVAGGAAVLAAGTAWFALRKARRDALSNFGVNPVGSPVKPCPDGKDSKDTVFGPGPIRRGAASELFRQMAEQKDIAFGYPKDGCYARAHIMLKRMQDRDATPGKVWTFAGSRTDPLWVNSSNYKDPIVWGYHVAPTIPVRDENGVVRDMVIDPSMFDHPVTIDEWKKAQHDSPVVVQTIPGQPPKPERGGSGYWPKADPPEGADENAGETMERYKRCEGKVECD
ncbi:MAG: protein-glutamine glutaminase family protein [Acidobacteriota bacterium]|nr:protein-glutamine glutaminase family protein [Acidobacteriota bacterium]